MDVLRLLETLSRLEAALALPELSAQEKLAIVEDVVKFVPPQEFVSAKGIHGVLLKRLATYRETFKGEEDGKATSGGAKKAPPKRKTTVSRKRREAP